MNSSIRLFSQLGLLTAALTAMACSNDATTATPSAPSTPQSQGTSAPAPACTYSLTPTSLSVAPAGGTSAVTVTTQSGCTWTAVTAASFVTITSGSSGSGGGSVVLNVAADSSGNRTGTVTVAGQTITVSQAGAGIIVAFEMLDPPTQIGPVASCRITGVPGYPISSCPLTSTARPTGSNFLVNWAWTLRYTYDGVAKTQTQSSGTVTDFSVWEYCGLNPSSAAGTIIPLSVSLTVTDNNGIQATATSGTGNQPAMSLITYTCGS